ncbi:unnamed protein product [Linum tenue]|uniref:Uncharacterized protein n=1 Tax=Linum tenue TaxID=586396 RepID=A0AAV0H768_9ROSI|nr:unnamed protein product [Linum tenue]CAI0380722.1 unnamed protein product [Linum tenue]
MVLYLRIQMQSPRMRLRWCKLLEAKETDSLKPIGYMEASRCGWLGVAGCSQF